MQSISAAPRLSWPTISKIDSSRLSGRRVRGEQPADAQMGGGARVFRDQRIGGLLHPIVKESVGAVLALDELGRHRRPQGAREARPRRSRGPGKRGELGVVAEAGELLQRLPALAPAGELSLPTMRSTTLSVKPCA